MGKEVTIVKTTIPSKTFRVSGYRKVFRIFYSTLFEPKSNIGSTGDIYLLETGHKLAIFWKRLREDRVTTVWREFGGRGYDIPHPVNGNLVLRGTCHGKYPHWCCHSSDDDNLEEASRQFLKDHGHGSAIYPIDITLNSDFESTLGSPSTTIDLTIGTTLLVTFAQVHSFK
ncbi:hypothetical protein CPB84DRAFT_1744753 [Gymnopilus junonius]|uniref:Uncharacterized protein n=1 Tax=Gymnopilus junonius TaxID=109634 RepID=A0A9P5NX73_GYMJU|nr:hypothetical protein CPB84DRAFT_1744753 [Gymnopilus junonius]